MACRQIAAFAAVVKIPAAIRREVFERARGKCECGCTEPSGRRRRATHIHHALDEQHFPELALEPDNMVAVYFACHFNHHAAYRRLPRAVIWRAERLATTGPRQSYLDRCYGV